MCKPGDLIWIHDYHLIMLPEILKKELPKARIGFFLHIPFPSSEIFTTLPKRKQILRGLLHCDMIGFHTYDYARHFMAACTRVLGLESNPGGLIYEGRFLPICVMPVGIDPEKFSTQLNQPDTITKIRELSSNFENKKLLLGVDRLDYIKGIPHRLRGFELFLQKHPEWQGKVVLIQIAVPSRTDVEKYQKLKRQVEQLVGHINGTYGSVGYTPILYLFKSVPFHELCALYRVSDAAIISSLRDGMNLVAQEYIACQQEKHGVLILSEFAGSSNALGSGALVINPWNVEDVANSIHEALSMSEDERAAKFERLYRYITKHTASHWGESFIKELDVVSRAAEQLDKTPKLTWGLISKKFKNAHHRLLVFSSDGALIPYVSVPFLATPPRRVVKQLDELTKDPRNIVYVTSGRDRNTLMKWFGHLNIGLVGENGFFYRAPKEKGQNAIRNQDIPWETLHNQCDLTFKQAVKPIFQHFTDRTPGSFFEEKETSLTWHFRSAERHFGQFRAQELHAHLVDSVGIHANVVVGEKSLELRPHECNPTAVLKKIMKRHENFDFMLYIGEPTTNTEEMTHMPHVFTASVERKNQKYYLENTEEVVAILRALATTGEHTESPKLPEFMRLKRRASPASPEMRRISSV